MIRSLGIMGLVALIVAAMIICPIVTIWALNVLFALNIELNIFTWAAMAWICAILIGYRSK